MPTRAEAVAKNIFGDPDADKNSTPATGIYAKYRELLRDSPWRWLIILASIGYLLSPVGLIPDFIPVIGFVDDGVVACILVHEIVLMILDEVNKRKARKGQGGKGDAAFHGEQSTPLLPGPGSSKRPYSVKAEPIKGASMYWSPPAKSQNKFPRPEHSAINLTT